MSNETRHSASRARGYVLASIVALVAALGLAAIIGIEPFDSGASSSGNGAGEKSGGVRAAAGDLARLVDSLSAGMSRSDYYEKPSEADRSRLARAFEAVRKGKLKRAAALARPLSYRVVRYTDRPTGRQLVLLAERPPGRHGWGLYAHSPGSHSRVIVEIAHPKADIKSEKVGVETFRRANASDLLMAGTHRYAASGGVSDVAHETRTVFYAINGAVISQRAIVFQPHGYDAEARTSEFGEIVASSGGVPTKLAELLAAHLSARGYDVCLYRPGRCEGLGATTNVEGQAVRAAGGSFIHLEMARKLRENRVSRERIASIVAKTLR
jgi:hypothetical protein